MPLGRDYVYDIRTKRESTRAVTETGSFVGHRCRAVDLGGLTPQGKKIADNASVPYIHDHNEAQAGTQQGQSWTTEEDLEGLPTPLTSAASFLSPNNSCIETVKQAFGGSFGAAGTLIAGAGSTTSTLDVTGGQGSRFVPGSVGFVTTLSGPGGTAQLELFLVRKVVGDTLHLTWALASIPSTGATVYNSETCYLDPAGIGVSSFSVYGEAIGENPDDQWKMRGCAPMIDIMGVLDEILAMGVTYQTVASEGPTAHGLTLGQTVPVGGMRKAITKSIVYYGNVTDADSAATRGVREHRSVSVHPNLALQEETGSGAAVVQGSIAHHQMAANPKANFDVTVMSDSTAYKAYFTDEGLRQAKYFAVQWGTQVASGGKGGIVFAVIPRGVFDIPVKRKLSDQMVHAEVEVTGTRPLMYTGGTTAIVRSPILLGVS